MSSLKDRQRKLLTAFHANNAKNSFTTIEHLYATAEDTLTELLTSARNKINAEYNEFRDKNPDDAFNEGKLSQLKIELMNKYFPDIKTRWDNIKVEVNEDATPLFEMAKRYLVSYAKEHSMVLMPDGLGVGSVAPYEPSPIQNIFLQIMPIMGTDKTLLNLESEAFKSKLASPDIRLRHLETLEDFEHLLANPFMRASITRNTITPLAETMASAFDEIYKKGFRVNPFKISENAIELTDDVSINGYPICDKEGKPVNFSDVLDHKRRKEIGLAATTFLLEDKDRFITEITRVQNSERIREHHVDGSNKKFFQKQITDIFDDLKLSYLTSHQDFSLKMRGKIAILWLESVTEQARAFTHIMRLDPVIRGNFMDDLINYKKELSEKYGVEEAKNSFQNLLRTAAKEGETKYLIEAIFEEDIENPKAREILDDVYESHFKSIASENYKVYERGIVRESLKLAIPMILPDESPKVVEDFFKPYTSFLPNVTKISEEIEKILTISFFKEEKQKKALNLLADFSSYNDTNPISNQEFDKIRKNFNDYFNTNDQIFPARIKNLIVSSINHALVSDITINMANKILDNSSLFVEPMQFRHIDTKDFNHKALANIIARLSSERTIDKVNELVGFDFIDKDLVFKSSVSDINTLLERMSLELEGIKITEEGSKGRLIFDCLMEIKGSDYTDSIQTTTGNILNGLIKAQFDGLSTPVYTNKAEEKEAYKNCLEAVSQIMDQYNDKSIALVAVDSMLRLNHLPSNYRTLMRSAENAGIQAEDSIPGMNRQLIDAYVEFLDGDTPRPSTANKYLESKKVDYMKGVEDIAAPTKEELDDEDLNHLFGKSL